MNAPRLETVVVSRKTPSDGRLQITEALATDLASAGPQLAIELGGVLTTARVHSVTCECGKGESDSAVHVHHFIESPLLATLTPGTEVALRLDEAGLVLSVDNV